MSAQALRMAGLAGILAIAALRALVLIEPAVWFTDVDPSIDAMPLLALGAAGSHILDLALVLASVVALIGEWRDGRGIRGAIVLLALVPAPIVLLHGSGFSRGDAFRGDTWLAGMCAFAALAHLVRERRMRVVAISVLASLMGLLAVRGAVQVVVEHPATVALYNETKQAFLADRGWLPDSSAALTYERRLMQPEASGWFGLSNPYSTLMGVGAVSLAALALLARRTQPSGNTLLLLLAAAGCTALLAVNGGKGAIGATFLAAAVLAWMLRSGRSVQGGWIAALCALALVAVVARGFIGSSLGERSLLFRSFYLDAGWTLLSKSGFLWVGTGPDRLQEFFAGAKPPQCPEDVKSLHSVFFDWVVTLGVAGAAWIAAVFAAFAAPVASGDEEEDDAGTARIALRIAVAIGVVATILQGFVEAPTVDVLWLVTRALGVLLFAMLAFVAAHACASVSTRVLASVSFAVAALVLVHAQIETVAWLPGSCALALSLVAAGSTLGSGAGDSPRVALGATLAAAPLLGIALVGVGLDAVRSVGIERRVAEIARTLTPLADARRSEDARTPEFRAREVELRLAAGEALSALGTREGMEHAIRQWLVVAAISPEKADGALDRAWKLANSAAFVGPRSGLQRADVALARIRYGHGDWVATEECVDTVGAAAYSQSSNPRRWIDFGVALEAFWARFPGSEELKRNFGRGSPLDARAAYEKALLANERLALDPLAQLSDRELAFVRAAIERVTPK